MAPPVALALSGGGARAAYQAGVLRAIANALPPSTPLPRALRRTLAGSGAAACGTAGLASCLLFDRDFCRELIALGRRDAEARIDEVRAFLSAQ
ncbi:MAG: hypothetical protein IPM02_09660 [Betaproteobacteria bacterium]|nr:hypothetical protein [Betaproteobacteria bacterium]